ncbi:uncharacterized protein FIESC28_09357 [Fusarium coffeatum]|uniref:Ribosomal protein L28 n=1 Tax=Fusarium coffeatum TaxID=231269 RepID=A0A366R0H7_9HYPO|nr:uncharacterized protein FIESC28_09357 [Fusarium coffeatum]RBR10651.1 hypothetical protein FIESC28_09357 [Fusarium coffeatum]
MTSWAPARPALRALASSSPVTPARAFSTTLPQQTKTIKSHLLPGRLIPPYPYGERQVYKQSNKGLYGSARIRFGNTVAEKYNNKARRFWRPNVHVKVFKLPALNANVKTRLTLRVLKTIRREGGLQEYLLKSKPARIKELGPGGWNLRWLLMQSKDIQKKFNAERVALGMEPKEIEDRDDIIQYALDVATPGPLSKRSQATRGELMAQEFVLGEEDLADLEGIEELSDEDEALLLKELENAEAGSETTSKDTQRISV